MVIQSSEILLKYLPYILGKWLCQYLYSVKVLDSWRESSLIRDN